MNQCAKKPVYLTTIQETSVTGFLVTNGSQSTLGPMQPVGLGPGESGYLVACLPWPFLESNGWILGASPDTARAGFTSLGQIALKGIAQNCKKNCPFNEMALPGLPQYGTITLQNNTFFINRNDC